jgi:hypothetical protein
MDIKHKKDIEKLLKVYNITGYTIHDNGVVDVDGMVDLTHSLLSEIPITFGVVSGSFYCCVNSLTTLRGAPKYVGGKFDCRDNKLRSLEYCPIEIGGDFDCSVNSLTSLKHSPKKIFGELDCRGNKLSTLEHTTDNIGGDLRCERNNLPWQFNAFYNGVGSDIETIRTFLRYQRYYDVWTPEFNVENFYVLVDEINDGLE